MTVFFSPLNNGPRFDLFILGPNPPPCVSFSVVCFSPCPQEGPSKMNIPLSGCSELPFEIAFPYEFFLASFRVGGFSLGLLFPPYCLQFLTLPFKPFFFQPFFFFHGPYSYPGFSSCFLTPPSKGIVPSSN